MQRTVVPSGQDPKPEVPDGAMDCGDGFFIVQEYEPCGEVRYRSCTPGGAICRYSNDLWQAQIYIGHFRGNCVQ